MIEEGDEIVGWYCPETHTKYVVNRRRKEWKAKFPRGLGAVLSRYETGAKARNLEFAITDEESYELMRLPCNYCGAELSNTYREPSSGVEFKYNGIDRVDSAEGYHYWNCVSCCGRCNKMKSDMGIGEFVAHIRRIHRSMNLT